MVSHYRVHIARGMLTFSLCCLGLPVQAQSASINTVVTEAGPEILLAPVVPQKAVSLAAAAVKAAQNARTLEKRSTSGQRNSLSCAGNMLWGVGIGAGLGAAYGAFLWEHGVEEPGKLMASTTLGVGLIGFVVGSRLCR